MAADIELVVRAARLRNGDVVDLAIGAGRVVAIAERGTVHAGEIVEADGRLVTESFVNAHLHLDKVYTLGRAGEDALLAYTSRSMAGAMTGIELARAVKEGYDRAWLVPNVRRALREAVRYGTLHILAFVDVDTTAGLEGLAAVLAARAEFADVLNVSVVAFPQEGVLRDSGAAQLCEEALRQGADVVGGIPWIEYSDADAAAHVDWACALAARTGRRVAMLVDDAADPSLRTTAMLAEAMGEHDLAGRGIACHARAVGSYDEPSQRRLAGLAVRAGLSFVADPHTGPAHLPVDLFDRLGVPVALGQDDIEDAYYPFGRNNMPEVAFLAAHLLELRSAPDLRRLLDFVTTGAARVLGVSDHGLAVGNPANLVVHDAEGVAELLSRHEPPRWVISRGRVVAETRTDTRFADASTADR
jgi:cytosine deaminase